jgi:large subunit ribosomal protein L18
MDKEKIKNEKKIRRKNRVRVKISGTSECPRLNVFRSNAGMYLQLIDDVNSKTVASASVKEIKEKDLNKGDAALALGKIIAEKALEKNIKRVVFDRSGYKYHGRVKLVADGAREGGLEF